MSASHPPEQPSAEQSSPEPRQATQTSDLEATAADAMHQMQERRKPASENALRRKNRFLVGWSLVVVVTVLLISYLQGDDLFNLGVEGPDLQNLIPFGMCFVGVAIFVMNTARRKKDQWQFQAYYGDHAFRVAQAFGYLLVVWWAWATLIDQGAAPPAGAAAQSVQPTTGSLPGTALTPNILGFLVGLFILRVERAMEGLGDKFEEALKAVLPRAVAYQSTEERRRHQLRGIYRMEDVLAEWKALRPQMDDLGARDMIDRAIDMAVEDAHGDDPERARAAVEQVGRLFEEVKQRTGETLVPVEELLGRV